MAVDASRISPLLRQIWTAAGVLLSMVSLGIAQGSTSVLLNALMNSDSPISLDMHLASWLVLGRTMSIFIGILSSTILMDIIGRKIAYIIQVIPGVAGMLLIYCATDFGTLMAARILDGIAAGGTVALGAVIIGEYTAPAYRGTFLNLKTACICLGSTIIHGIGHFLHWKTVALIALVPYAISLVIIVTWKESPAWLASRNKTKEAEQAFIWLRGDSEECRTQLDDLIKAQEERTASRIKNICFLDIKTLINKMKRKDFLKPLLIMVCSSVLLEACGRHLVPAFSVHIIGSITGHRSYFYYYILAIDLIVTISSTCSSILIKMMKTRTLLFSTGICSLVVLGSACLYLFLASQDIVSQDRPLIPLSMSLLYFILINLGCTPIPLALIGEIFPLEYKSLGLFVSGIVGCILMIGTLKVFPYLVLTVDIYGTFALLGFVMAAMLVCLYFILPETKNRTLQEIEDHFKFGKVQKRGRRDESKMSHSNI